MPTLQFPTQAVPSASVELIPEKLIVRPGNTVRLDYRDGSMFRPGSLWVDITGENNEEERALLRSWILFHCFLFGETFAAKHHDSGQFDYDMTNEGASYDWLFDPNSVLPRAYFIYVEKSDELPVLSYSELFVKFQQADETSISRIKNCLMSLGPTGPHTSDPIFDPAYWQLIPPFSVIEDLIGQPPVCSGKFCPECRGKYNHHAVPMSEWIPQRFIELVSDEVRRAEFNSQYKAARKKIRHGTVHQSLQPTARHHVQSPGTSVYDSQRAASEFQEDRTALLALSSNLRDIARWLMMNSVFTTEVFPTLVPLKSTTIASGQATQPTGS